MAYCEKCGTFLQEGARFCPACGEPVAQDTFSERSAAGAPPSSSPWTCASCATVNAPEARFCKGCRRDRDAWGAAAPSMPTPTAGGWPTTQTQPMTAAIQRGPQVPQAPPQGGGGGGRSRRTIWIILAVAAAVAVAAGVGYFFLIRGTSTTVDDNTFTEDVSTLLTALAPATEAVQAHLPQSLRECTWSKSLGKAVRSAEALRTAVRQSKTDAAELEPGTSEQTATKQALDAALTALATYADAVAALPPKLSTLKADQAQAVRGDADAAQQACDALAATAASLPRLAVNDCSVLPAGAHKARRDAALRVFLIKVQNDILNQSQYGRSDIVEAVNGVNGMTMNPDDAATMIEGVQSNRQSLLDQLSSMTVPDDQRATRTYDLLQQSLQHSIEADRYYAAWMHEVYDYYYQEPEGYLGSVPHDPNYDEAVNQSGMAGTAKSAFCRAYNPLARKFGMKHDWTQAQL